MTDVDRLEAMRLTVVGITAACLLSRVAAAQEDTRQGPLALTVEGYANVTGAARARMERTQTGFDSADRRLDAAARLFGRVDTEEWTAGARVVFQTIGASSPEFGDRSLVLSHAKLGRLEVGWRQGLPDTLTGYAPNVYTFTAVEFGPPTGLNLFPQGGLQTSFLPPSVGAKIAGLSYLGASAALAGDQSPKLIYVAPRISGFQLGFSASPNADDAAGGASFGASAQAGVLHETYFGQNVLRVGGSYTFARGESDRSRGLITGDLHSGNVGVTLVLDDELYLGLSFTADGRSGGVHSVPAATSPFSVGAVASASYEVGRWAVGGFLQWARGGRDVDGTGSARLRSLEIGGSYRVDTRLRFYAAAYGYRLDDQAGPASLGSVSGTVLLAGIRATL